MFVPFGVLLQLLGFKLGVFHVELKATSRGPSLIEVNARMGGGGVRWADLSANSVLAMVAASLARGARGRVGSILNMW